MGKRNRIIAVSGAFIGCSAGFLSYIGVFGGNIHEVVPGAIYRSAQLTDGTLQNEIRRDHIESVINLRGSQPDSGFYESEIKVCSEMGVKHDDIGLSAHRFPQPDDLNELLKDFDHMPKPILVHCKAGSDRTGLVSALYMHLSQGEPISSAEGRELNWHFGHFGMFGTQAMDDFFDLYRKTSSGQDIRTWAHKTYPSIYLQLQEKHSWEVSPKPGGE